VVPVPDGAAWITSVADGLPAGMGKTYVLDVFHALGYASAAIKALVRCDDAQRARLAEARARLLDGKVGRVIAEPRPHRHRNRDVAKRIDRFGANRERMRHDECRARGMRIGSGQIGSCRRRMVATRFRRPGCGRSMRGANALPALKTCWKNMRWEQFVLWKAQRIATA